MTAMCAVFLSCSLSRSAGIYTRLSAGFISTKIPILPQMENINEEQHP